MPRRKRPFTPWLESVASTLWASFLFWTALIAILWATNVSAVDIASWRMNPGPRAALVFLANSADAIWIVLGAVNVHLAVAESHGLSTARRWAAIVCIGAGLIAACSAWRGVPLGSVLYTTRLGFKLGPVPSALPLLWFIAVVGGRELTVRLLPRAGHATDAIGAGIAVLLTSLNIDPLASHARAFWFWIAAESRNPISTPISNHLTWWIAGTALAFTLRENHVGIARTRGSEAPIVVLLLLNAVALLTHGVAMLRG